jgi:hypothetical protein
MASPSASTLPPAPTWFEPRIASLSDKASKLLIAYLVAVSYCALTLTATTDRRIALNEATHLPIVNIDIGFDWFCLAGAALVLIVYVGLQIEISSLNKLVSEIVATSDVEFRSIDTSLLVGDFGGARPVTRMRSILIAALLWWSLPLLLIRVAFVFVKVHDPILWHRISIGVLPVIGVACAILFWSQLSEPENWGSKRTWSTATLAKHSAKVFLCLTVLVFEAVLFLYLMPSANAGKSGRHCFTCIDLSHQLLVNKPQDDYKTVYWLNLGNRHLEGVNVVGAVLKRAVHDEIPVQPLHFEAFSSQCGGVVAINCETVAVLRHAD